MSRKVLIVTGDGGVLIARRQFTVQRKQNVTARFGGVPNSFQGLADFEAAGHEHEHVASGARANVVGESVGGEFPGRRWIGAKLAREVLDVHRKHAAFGGKDSAMEGGLLCQG